jgi:hypothetical protein
MKVTIVVAVLIMAASTIRGQEAITADTVGPVAAPVHDAEDASPAPLIEPATARDVAPVTAPSPDTQAPVAALETKAPTPNAETPLLDAGQAQRSTESGDIAPMTFMIVSLLAVALVIFAFRGRSANPVLICPHCATKGHVRTRQVKMKQGIDGGKAAAAWLTGGASVLFTGLSRREKKTQARCGQCKSTWHF